MNTPKADSAKNKADNVNDNFYVSTLQKLHLNNPIIGGLFLLTVTMFITSIIISTKGITESDTNENVQIEKSERQEFCESNKGKWLEEFNECEGVKRNTCVQADGRYYDCESPCRNDPESEVCILSCVSVCKF